MRLVLIETSLLDLYLLPEWPGPSTEVNPQRSGPEVWCVSGQSGCPSCAGALPLLKGDTLEYALTLPSLIDKVKAIEAVAEAIQMNVRSVWARALDVNLALRLD